MDQNLAKAFHNLAVTVPNLAIDVQNLAKLTKILNRIFFANGS